MQRTVASRLAENKRKLLDQVRNVIGVKHYSIRTEQAYVDWIKRFIFFHGKRHPAEMAEEEVAQFLTHLAHSGLPRNLPARVQLHNQGLVPLTKRRAPFQLVYWEDCLNESNAAEREKYLKTAWGKRYIKTRLRRYLTG